MKEQIIIDGVDVNECFFYQSNFEEDYDVKIKHFCSNWHNSCESVNNSNCYFKQLARKTQECEELKKTVLTKCPNCNSEYLTPKGIELYEENKRLMQECEELKKVNEIINNLEFTLDLDKYIEVNKLIKKPVKKAKFTKELLNIDIILSYLVNTIKIEDYLKIKDILLKEVNNANI